MKALGTAALLLAALGPTVVWADDEECDSVLINAGQNSRFSHNREALDSYNWRSYCGVKASSMSDRTKSEADVNIFGQGSVGGESSTETREERIDNWCDEHAEASTASQFSIDMVKTVFEPAIRA
jgi:hypothetical protein